MNLYLVGYRCTGKTSVGRLLSDAMGWTFVDMDNELVTEAGIPIEDIVVRRGWEHFREIEARLLERLSQTKCQVIATGGGVVTVRSNVTAMRATGKVVWLKASPAVLAERMAADINTASQRPPLRKCIACLYNGSLSLRVSSISAKASPPRRGRSRRRRRWPCRRRFRWGPRIA